jgi:hypothetical protein
VAVMILIVPLLLFTHAKIKLPPALTAVPATSPMMSAAVAPIASLTRISHPFLTEPSGRSLLIRQPRSVSKR